jgi:YVTN family beta-propeller protein
MDSNTVSVIADANDTAWRTINVGSYPYAATYDSAKGEIFVANNGNSNVSVIDCATWTVVATINVGYSPDGVAYDNDLGEIAVENWGSDNVTVLSDATNTAVANVSFGVAPDFAAYDSAKGEIFSANEDNSNVSIISDLTNKVVASVNVGGYPDAVAYDSGMGEVFVGNWYSDNVSVINDTTDTVVATISGLPYVYALCYDNAKGEIFAANSYTNYLSIISDATNTVAGTVAVGNYPDGLAFDGALGEVFVANSGDGTVSVVADSTNMAVDVIGVGNYPDALTYDSGLGEVFVANAASDNVSVIDAATNKVVSNIGVGSYPNTITYDDAMGEVYTANWYSNNVTVISDATNSVVANIAAGNISAAAVYDPSNGYVYDGNYGQGTFSIIPTWPTLTGVTVTPPSPKVAPLGSIVLTATPACSGGNCPPGANYTWSLTNGALGSLNATTGSVVKFTAGSTLGLLNLFVNATLHGVNVKSSAIPLTIAQTITGVTVSPTSATVYNRDTVWFNATVTCTGGPCPAQTTYSWTISSAHLGTLKTPTTNAMEGFTAGFHNTGTVGLFVNATLSGTTVTFTPVIITVSAAPTAVTVTPAGPDVAINAGQAFTAVPTCTGGPCPLGTTYSWSLTNGLGSLNASTSSVVGFTAGSTTGVVVLFANATLNGVTVRSSPDTITITLGPPPALGTVTVSPSSALLVTRATQVFTAIPSCAGGAQCSGVSYTWALSGAAAPGHLNVTTGSVVLFTASGGRTGQTLLYCNATQGANVAQATPVPITVVSALTGLTVAPAPTPPATTINVSAGGTQWFNVTPTCGRFGGVCSPLITYVWNLTSTLLGSLNTTTGSNVTFMAGYTTGDVTLYVNASLAGTYLLSAPTVIWVNASGVPTLSSVSVSPNTASVKTGASQDFAATPTCTGGTCPPAVTYAWTLTAGSMGYLNIYSGASVVFTANSTTGTVGLFVNATFNGVTVLSSATIITISSTSSTTLTSVSVAPGPTITIAINDTKMFQATPVCSTGVTYIGDTCPTTGISYSWSLSNSLGTLSTSSTAFVNFTAGSKAGTVTLFLNATLSGNTVPSPLVVITVSATPVLPIAAVNVSPKSDNLTIDGTVQFTATPVCSGGSCSSGTTFAWTLTNKLGTLSPATGSVITFTAGTTAGAVTLFVNATLNGKTVMSSPVPISISATTVPVLSSVTVSPGSDTITVGGNAQFTATPVCTGGTCPAGTVYAWSLTSKLGTISSTPGATVNFTAGQNTGTLTLFVNATLNGVKATGQVVITIKAASSSNLLGLSTSSWYIVIAVIVVVVALVLIALILRRRGGSSKKGQAWWQAHEGAGAAAGTGGAAAVAGPEEPEEQSGDASPKDEKVDDAPAHEAEDKTSDTTSPDSAKSTEGDIDTDG